MCIYILKIKSVQGNLYNVKICECRNYNKDAFNHKYWMYVN